MRKRLFAGTTFLFSLTVWTWLAQEEKTAIPVATHLPPAASTAATYPDSALAEKSKPEQSTAPTAPLAASAPLPQKKKQPDHQPAAPSVWERLEKPVVLATEIRPQPDGSVRRARLVQVSAKYPYVVFEGTLPNGALDTPDTEVSHPTAQVADHLIVRSGDGVTEDQFRQAITTAGMRLGGRLDPQGPWLVHLPTPTLGGVARGVKALQTSGAVAYAEPDYLIHAADIPTSRTQVDSINGVATYPESALNENTARPPETPTLSADALAGNVNERLRNLPAGTRIITFDPPTFLGGPAAYNPYLEEQNFVVSTDTGAYVQGATASFFGNNGTYYALSGSSANNFTVRHRENLPFSIFSLDLSEFAVGWEAKTVTFVGYKAGGGTVSQTFTTDGLHDGTGPQDDFETFTFNSDFTHLTKVVANTTTFAIDNIAVLVEGQESTPPAPPAPPLLYHVTWDAPKHTVDQLTAVAGPYAPSSINFGTPTVRNQIGTLAGPALELSGSGYQQIRFGIRSQARAYRLEFDSYIDASSFVLHFDGASGTQSINFKSNGGIDLFQSFIGGTILTAAYTPRKNVHIAVDIDMLKPQWELFVDGVSKFRGTFGVSDGDLTDIRFHQSGGTGVVGIDNVQISAFGAANGPTTGPRISVSSRGLTYPELPIGSSKTWYLTLYNSGSQTLTVQNVASTDNQFIPNWSSTVGILPGGSFSVPVDFQPKTVGTITGTVNITSNDPGKPTVSIPVTGSSIGMPRITLNPANLFVTMLANTQGTRTFEIGNPGVGNLTWDLVVKGQATTPGPPTDPSRSVNDPLFSSLWAMRSPQPSAGGIDAVHAWSVTTGSTSNVIAVTDTGVDRTHPDLQGNLWVNAGEIPGNGIDDDHNGYVDDVNGWDFYNFDNDPADGNGHGTHIAGTIAARGNNSIGVTGVCWSAQIMPLKLLSDSGSAYTSDAVAAVTYASRMGARISNNSWGGGGYSQSLYDAIKAAGSQGSLFVTTAGNNNADNDATPYYPANYPLECILSVAATDRDDQLAYFSNYGANTVHLTAPGVDILSLRPGGQYATLSGTSIAAPHVAGTAGLLLARNPSLTVNQMKQLIIFGSDSIGTLGGKIASQGRLNAYRALKAVVPRWLQPQVTHGTVRSGLSVPIPLTVDTKTLPVGSYMLTLAISSNDPVQPVLDLPVTLNIVPRGGFVTWTVDQFGSDQMLANSTENSVWSASADPDLDGLSNLVEFVTGSDPSVAKPQDAPTVVSVNGENLFEFHVRDALEGAQYHIEWTPSLSPANWQTTGLTLVEDTTVGQPAGQRRLRTKLTSPRATAFFRLVAEQAQ